MGVQHVSRISFSKFTVRFTQLTTSSPPATDSHTIVRRSCTAGVRCATPQAKRVVVAKATLLYLVPARRGARLRAVEGSFFPRSSPVFPGLPQGSPLRFSRSSPVFPGLPLGSSPTAVGSPLRNCEYQYQLHVHVDLHVHVHVDAEISARPIGL